MQFVPLVCQRDGEISPAGIGVIWGKLIFRAGLRRQSFPRKRESTPQTFGDVPSSHWIPAFAGMTGGSSGSPFRMTPAPPSPASQFPEAMEKDVLVEKLAG
jgi:hypothetical protein